MTLTPGKVFAVGFANLTRWSVNSFFTVQWQWPEAVIQPLSHALERKSAAPKDSSSVPKMITLHFDGEMVPRKMDTKRVIKGRIIEADAGDVIYSKIDVRNGAIGVVPPSMPKVAVTTEFPVYSVRREIADPSYIKLVFRTSAFRRQINSMISGASGRKRVQPADLEQVRVPLPPLATQRAIVSEWELARQTTTAAEERVGHIEAEIESAFIAALGLKLPPRVVVPRYFAVPWDDFYRWSVSYNQAVLTGAEITRGKFPVVELGSVLSLVQYGTSEKANTRGIGAPIIRMNNIVDGLLDLSDMKHVELPEKERNRLLLDDGDILFNRTNSKELVGKCAVFHSSGQYVFASYLIRLRTHAEHANPDYLTFVLNSLIGRHQIDALSRQAIGQANINSEELRSLRIPLPPLEVQHRIVAQVEAQRDLISAETQMVQALSRQVEADVEAYLLGTKKVGMT